MELYDHQFMKFAHHGDRIDFIWKPATEAMAEHEFMYTILRYASYVMEHRTRKVLIDLTDFKFTPGEAGGQFHADYVTKIYNMMGVTRKVFVAPFMENKVIGKEPGTEYDNAFMNTYAEAVAWLNQSE